MPTVHLIIKGKVQGVFFRATAKEVAEEIGITGWVKNTSEGNVESIATGSEEQIQNYIAWCKEGPPRAVVSEVIVNHISEVFFNGFQVIR